jgi:hypothetical protein
MWSSLPLCSGLPITCQVLQLMCDVVVAPALQRPAAHVSSIATDVAVSHDCS